MLTLGYIIVALNVLLVAASQIVRGRREYHRAIRFGPRDLHVIDISIVPNTMLFGFSVDWRDEWASLNFGPINLFYYTEIEFEEWL